VNGKVVAGFIVIAAVLAGAGVWYTQEYAYFYDVEAEAIGMTTIAGVVEPVAVRDFQGVDADSSPLRYRACFSIDISLAALSEEFEIAPHAEPRNGPRSFTCYDAAAGGALLENGEAVAFVAQHDIHPGFDRIVAVTRDGTAFAWHQPAEGE
jgi:hypothetical protein